MIRIDTTLTPSLLSLHPAKNSRVGLSSFIPPATPSRAGGGSYASGLMNIASPRLTQVTPRLPLIQEFDDVIMSSGHPSPPPSAIAEIHPDITSPPDQGNTTAAASSSAAARGMMIEEEERLGLPVKMAFITFNLQSSVKRCIDSCPSSEDLQLGRGCPLPTPPNFFSTTLIPFLTISARCLVEFLWSEDDRQVPLSGIDLRQMVKWRGG